MVVLVDFKAMKPYYRMSWLPVVDEGCCCCSLEMCCKTIGYFCMVSKLSSKPGECRVSFALNRVSPLRLQKTANHTVQKSIGN